MTVAILPEAPAAKFRPGASALPILVIAGIALLLAIGVTVVLAIADWCNPDPDDGYPLSAS
jgi:hypothetical protein